MPTVFTSDLSDGFFSLAKAIAERLRAQLRHLLAVMFAESGLVASIQNHAGSGAVGTLQFMPSTLVGMGYTGSAAAFAALSAEAQLPWVERYLSPYRTWLDTLAGVYCAVFMPADIAHRREPAFVISAKGGRRGWAYALNESLDRNRDGAITVGELEAAVERLCVGDRWNEILVRSALAPEASRFDETDLRTTRGLQAALAVLGYAPGPVDGIPGARTKAALVAFQRAESLAPDGIPGTLTRAALARRLAARQAA